MPSSAADRVVARPRRVYTKVEVAAGGGGFVVALDGRSARTPARHPLAAPTRALADRIAAEWEAQAKEIDFAAMPATRLAFTALDRTPLARPELADEIARYAGSDLLLYQAEEPAGLVEEEARRWGPELEWAARSLGLALSPTAGIVHRPQPPAAQDRARELAAALDDFRLTGLAFAAALFGSAVLAFGLERGRLTGEEAHHLARLDEAWQERAWGVDAEAAARTAARLAEASAAEAWFRALGGGEAAVAPASISAVPSRPEIR